MLSHLSKLILYHIYHSVEPISSHRLSIYCDSAINTIRKEIAFLNDELKQNGCCISSKQAYGYQLIVTDAEKSERFFKSLKFNKKMHTQLKLMENYRSFFIIRSLLVSSNYLNPNDFCELLHCSYSTIARDIKDAKSYLEKFALSIHNKKLHGLYIKGDEWNQRLCLIEQHKLFCQMDQQEQNLEQKFQRYLMVSPKSYAVFLKRASIVLSRHPAYQIAFMNLPKIIIYLILCINRQNKSKDMIFSQSQIQLCHNSSNYVIAMEIFETIKRYGPYDFCEQDALTLTMLLCVYQSSTSITCLEEEIQSFLRQDSQGAIEVLSKRYPYIDFSETEFYNSFLCQMHILYYQIAFHIPVDEEFFHLIEYEGLLAIDLCVALSNYLSALYEKEIDQYYILGFYYLFNHILMKTLSNARKYNLLVLSQFGIHYANNVADRLRKVYDRFIDTIYTKEFRFYDNLDTWQVDCILSDIHLDEIQKGLRPYQTIPFIELDFTQSLMKSNELKSFFSHIYQKEAYAFLDSRISFCSFKTKHDVMKAICELYSTQQIQEDRLLNSLHDRESYIHSVKKNNIVLLTTFDPFPLSSSIQLFINQTPVTWDHHSCRLFIFYYISPESLDVLKLIHYILSKIFDLSMDKLIELYQCRSSQECLKLINL